MRQSSCLVALLAVVLLGTTRALADPIAVTITSGTAAFNPNSSSGAAPGIRLFGTDGFSFVGVLGLGQAGPDCCLRPGTTAMFTGFWSGTDMPGVATYAGETYANVGSAASLNQASIRFVSDSFVVPAPGPSTTTVSAPFTLGGTFHGAPGNGQLTPTLFATLSGSGIGRVPLSYLPEAGGWRAGIVTLDMTSPAPTPEPTSLALIGLGAAGAAIVRRPKGRAASRGCTC